ncbi:hypothetical protein CLRAG_25030 [Clostridium ragsdalei P11]|uniref:Uncharacterized protein n=1 Tax=Clostridium ragsdalei P11 TaxID=1353534 RepID=A0A1A6AQJ5_9CLOT|nr:hypothetical protein CLRAG_25030 [Clostridium ragsdalei P11]
MGKARNRNFSQVQINILFKNKNVYSKQKLEISWLKYYRILLD